MSRKLIPALLAVALTAGAAPINDEEAAFTAAFAALKEHKLTELKEECLSLIALDPNEDSYPIQVREKHDEKCGGDPNTAPLVAQLEVTKADGRVSVYDPVSDEKRPLE